MPEDAAPAPGATGVQGDRDPPRQTGGYIRVYRSLLDHPLWTTVPDAWLRVALAILLRANWRPVSLASAEGEIRLQPGSLLTSSEKLAELSRTSRQQVRDALAYLESTGFITSRRTNRYTVITVSNWATYQSDNLTGNQRRNHQRTSKEPAGEPTENQQPNPCNDGPSEPAGGLKKPGREPAGNRQKNHRGRSNHHQAATQESSSPAFTPPAPPARSPAADDEKTWESPEAEFQRRMKERHGDGLDVLDLQRQVHEILGVWGIGLDEWLRLDGEKTTRVGGLKNPVGYYLDLAKSLARKAEGRLFNNDRRLRRDIEEQARCAGNTQRCSTCGGSGKVGEGYCSCKMGRDLRRVEQRGGGVAHAAQPTREAPITREAS